MIMMMTIIDGTILRHRVVYVIWIGWWNSYISTLSSSPLHCTYWTPPYTNVSSYNRAFLNYTNWTLP